MLRRFCGLKLRPGNLVTACAAISACETGAAWIAALSLLEEVLSQLQATEDGGCRAWDVTMPRYCPMDLHMSNDQSKLGEKDARSAGLSLCRRFCSVEQGRCHQLQRRHECL